MEKGKRRNLKQIPTAHLSSEGLWQIAPIGFVESPFHGKFGVPRQPGLMRKSEGVLQLSPDSRLINALQGLEEFTHLWVIFVFHAHGAKDWRPSIRPPRLGGRRKIGVLASRSPHRPSLIGMSVVKIRFIDIEHPTGPRIGIEGHDLLDQTPILDIKPYLPYADSVPEASSGWAPIETLRFPVSFSSRAQQILRERPTEERLELERLIIEMIELDPRPAFQQRKFPLTEVHSQGLRYGVTILDWDVKYQIYQGGFLIYDLAKE